MPPRLERRLSGVYRSIFVDLRKVASILAASLVPGAKLLDIGGGDGELLNYLLAARSDLRVTMVDIAPSVGKFLEEQHRDRVELCPDTSLEQHLASVRAAYDAVLVSDVMHHLPCGYRERFLRATASALAAGGSVFVKDLEPGHPIAWLSLVCDQYVSGDRGVALISAREVGNLAARVLPAHCISEIGLLVTDRPNYLLRLDFSAA